MASMIASGRRLETLGGSNLHAENASLSPSAYWFIAPSGNAGLEARRVVEQRSHADLVDPQRGWFFDSGG
jgi:hypothetical protein